MDARLLLVSFIGDSEMNGPGEVGEWNAAFNLALRSLGLAEDRVLAPHVLHVHPDVADLARPVRS